MVYNTSLYLRIIMANVYNMITMCEAHGTQINLFNPNCKP